MSEAFFNLLSEKTWLSLAGIVAAIVWFWGRRMTTQSFSHDNYGAWHGINLIDLAASLFGVFSAFSFFALFPNSGVSDVAGISARVVADLAAHLLIAMASARFIELLWISRSNFENSGQLPGLPRVLLFSAALSLSATAFGVGQGLSVNSLYISTGALAAIIAFAMQRTLGDLFSGISLSVEHPFKIGDWIELENGTQGEVRDMNWRATRLRGWDNATIVVPNGELAAQTFKNLHGPGRRYSPWYDVYLPAEIDPRFAKTLMLDAALKCKKTLPTPQPSVRLVDSGTAPYKYMVWLHFETYSAMFAGREEFHRNLHYALRDAGIQGAPPVQDLRLVRGARAEADPPSIGHAMRGLDFTSFFNEAEMKALIERSYTELIDAGAVILAEGDVAMSVDVVLTGAIETSVLDARGRPRTLKPLNSGEYFGLASMLMDAPSFQSFTASTDVNLLRIDLTCFREIVTNRAELISGFAEIVDHRMGMADTLRKMRDQPTGGERLGQIARKIERMFSEGFGT